MELHSLLLLCHLLLLYIAIGPGHFFCHSSPHPPRWTTVSLRVVTSGAGKLKEVRVVRPLHGEVICMYELGRCFCRYVTGLLETI